MSWVDSLLTLLVLTNLVVLSSSRVWETIRVVALQGLLLGAFTLLGHRHDLTPTILLVALGSGILKGLVFPFLLFRAVRETDIRNGPDPFIGYNIAMLVGAGLLPVALWVASRLPDQPHSSRIVPVALHTIFVGLLLIVTRRKALSQILGYLVLEDGIYAFGSALVREAPLIVEFGILLDLLVAVCVMGVTLFDLNRGFSHVDTARLMELRE
ncbi:MAG: hydrogenase [Cyanobacteria bacterium REEB65]|nr:hydrogenase [Cyanobacteria bacterium REEB65]